MARPTDPHADQAIGWLLGRIDYERSQVAPYPERDFRLQRMHELLKRLGSPHERLRVVHVAGTKGKGSTSAMIAAILTAAGNRTGLYTSPHLRRLEERIQIDQAPCSADELCALIDCVRSVVEQLDGESRQRIPAEPGPTYFDITTAMAFLHFAQCGTDIAVMEVGLGGRLDSTNVCHPLVSVITSISFDHTQQLGDTLTAITREKAGIIKPGVPVVSGVDEPEPRAVIEEIAAQTRSPLRQLARDFDFRYTAPRDLDSPSYTMPRGILDYESKGRLGPHRIDGIELSLPGRHQAANAAVALTAIGELESHGMAVVEQAIRQGLRQVQWPARVEVMSHRPTVVVDSAHNTASIRCLLETLDESFSSRRRLLIFATTQDKDLRGMLELLLTNFEAVILTRYLSNPRAVSLAELESAVEQLSPIPRHVCPDPAAAWKLAQELTTPDHLVCVTGSLFLAAEMRDQIAIQQPTPADTAAWPCVPA